MKVVAQKKKSGSWLTICLWCDLGGVLITPVSRMSFVVRCLVVSLYFIGYNSSIATEVSFAAVASCT